MKRSAQTARRRRAGSSIIEFSIVVPVFLAFLMGEIEFGRREWTQQALQVAGEQTARCVAIGSSLCSSAASYAVSTASSLGVLGLTAGGVQIDNAPPAVTNSAACNPPGSLLFVRVTLTLAFVSPISGMFSGINKTLVTVSCYPVIA